MRETKKLYGAVRGSLMLPATALGIGLSTSVPFAHATIAQPDEIVVTARRTEEVIQNVPISMTVFNQDMLNEHNVTSGADLGSFTPSLSVNTRFGSDQASFAIRGFTQEIRTTASVAVYFADVVAPRGGGNVTAGDGAGPGAFFDLQNVQVLKGPQGTLFGRNTTGGAIQLVPNEPTTKLEGYLEESLGTYNMRRTQGVINIPISDNVRSRFGLDTERRDGYLKNVSGVGPNHLGNVDYIAGRGSVMWDVSDSVSNYTILTYSNSANNGIVQALFACNPNGQVGASLCGPALALTQAGGYYAVASGDVPDPQNTTKQWQAINTTTWNAGDDLTLKNLLSYGKLKQRMRSSVFGSDFVGNGQHIAMSATPLMPGLDTNSQKSFVEELQFNGNSFAKKLAWQSGLYFENSRPDGLSGSASTVFSGCPQGINSTDPAQWQCIDPFGVGQGASAIGGGTVQVSVGKTEYKNLAAYSQGTYDFNDEFRLTVGLRYTVDKTSSTGYQKLYWGFPTTTTGAPNQVGCVVTTTSMPDCGESFTQKSEAPTWLIDFDYLPTPDTMIYTKYARGYRQGSINIFGAEGVETFKPEKVDAYEIGEKTSFRGFISGTANLALFYNKLTDQQIQVGYSGPSVSTTTGILNAGASTIEGLEAETTLKLTQDLTASLSYTYLATNLESLNVPTPTGVYNSAIATSAAGKHLPFSPRHNGTAALNYKLPFPSSVGEISIGGSYNYTSEQLSNAGTTYGYLESRKLVNANLNWKGIFGSGFDASAFVTNLTRQKYATFIPGFYDNTNVGVEFRGVGEPRMAGVRVRYNFE